LKIITFDRFKRGVTMETITPLLPEEAANAWRSWKAGIIRENYARADEPGAVIVFECADVAEAKRYLENFPMTKAGYIVGECIPVITAPLPLRAYSTRQSMYLSPLTGRGGIKPVMIGAASLHKISVPVEDDV
jgi:hypothetical protein